MNNYNCCVPRCNRVSMVSKQLKKSGIYYIVNSSNISVLDRMALYLNISGNDPNYNKSFAKFLAYLIYVMKFPRVVISPRQQDHEIEMNLMMQKHLWSKLENHFSKNYITLDDINDLEDSLKQSITFIFGTRVMREYEINPATIRNMEKDFIPIFF